MNCEELLDFGLFVDDRASPSHFEVRSLRLLTILELVALVTDNF